MMKFDLSITGLYYILILLLLLPIGYTFAQSESTIDELFQQLEELEKQEKYHSGLRLVQQFIEDYPENLDAKALECSLLLNAKYPTEDVQNCLENIPSQLANSSLVLLTTGSLYANLGDYEDARDQFKKVVELYPNNKYAEALYYTNLLILDTGNAEYLDKLKEIYESTNDLRILQNIIIFLNDREEFTEAELLLKYALEVDPENSNFLISMGVWNAKQGKLLEAEKDFLSALDKEKDNVTLFNNLGLLYLELGDETNNIEFYKKSTTFYQSVLQLDPDNDYALNGVENAQNKQGYSYQRIFEIINYQLGAVIITSFAIAIVMLYSLYRRYQNLQKLDYESRQKENKIKLILSYKMFFVIGSGLLSIPITLYLVSFAYTIPIKGGFDLTNWASLTVELAIGVTIAVVILVYELSKNKKFHDQQLEIEKVVSDINKEQVNISNIIRDVKQIEIKQDKRESGKSDTENKFYKLDLLPNLSSLLLPIFQVLMHRQSFEQGLESDEEFKKNVKSMYDEFGYWADRITNINSNTYVPPEIRNTVRMLLHQAIKPITYSESAFVEDFLEKTVFYYVDKIIDSDYIKNDQDESVKDFRAHVVQSRQSIFESREEYKNKNLE